MLMAIFFMMALWHSASPLTVGSNTAVSRQANQLFTAGATNTILGFAALENGFSLESNLTTCTYNAFFPMGGKVNMRGGQLTLARNLIFDKSFYTTSSGVILGGSNSIEFGATTTDLVFRDSLYFNNTSLLLNNDTRVYALLQFGGNCKINGRGSVLNLQNPAGIIIRPNSQLILEDVFIKNVGRTNIRCMNDGSSLTLRNSIVALNANYTFSNGSITFDEDVMITGTSVFAYTSGVGSTVNSLATLFMDHDTTFSYATRRALNNVLTMIDQTSTLFLNGCTLFSTHTGLQIQAGTLLIEDTVTFSSMAYNSGEAIDISPNVTTKIKGGSNLQIFGRLKYG